MRRRAVIGAMVIALAATPIVKSGEHVIGEPSRPHFFQRLHPSGGYNPGGGLFHWWDPCCLPQACGPNDYCRKPFPNLCRYPIAPACAVQGHPHAPAAVYGVSAPR